MKLILVKHWNTTKSQNLEYHKRLLPTSLVLAGTGLTLAHRQTVKMAPNYCSNRLNAAVTQTISIEFPKDTSASVVDKHTV